MNPQDQPALGVITPRLRPVDDRMLGWIGRIFGLATLAGLGIFGTYVALRGTRTTIKNFEQWHALVTGLPMPSVSDWIANPGIGLHFLMGAVLVLAWPIRLSAQIPQMLLLRDVAGGDYDVAAQASIR
jgi:hypothetical protein